MRHDDYFSHEEMQLMGTLKGKNRMEQDQIIFEYERKMSYGNAIRNDNTGK